MRTGQMVKMGAHFKGFSVRELAKKTGMSKSALYRKLKEHDFKLEELVKISKALKADFNYYLSFPDGEKIGTVHKNTA